MNVKKEEPLGLNVRLKYSMIINFTTKILGIAFNFIFVWSLVRSLPVEDYGLWTIMMSYFAYFLPFIRIYLTWTGRTVSRGFNTSKSSLFLAVTLGTIASFTYLPIAYWTHIYLNKPLLPLALIAIAIFEEYLMKSFIALTQSHAPQHVGISLLLINITQATLGFYLVYVELMGILGAVISVIVARAISLLYLCRLNLKLVKRSIFSIEVAKDWLKKSWLPIYSGFAVTFASFDVIILRIITNSDVVVAYYGLLLSILNVTLASTQALPALQSRLLAKRDINDILEAFWVAFALSFPIIVPIFLYAEQILRIYNPTYLVLSKILRLFVIIGFLRLIVAVLRASISAMENRDILDYYGQKVKLRKTLLFYIPTVEYIVIGCYLLALYLTITLTKLDPLETVLTMGLLLIAENTALIILFDRRLLRGVLKIKLPYLEILRFMAHFLIASFSFFIIYYIFKIPIYLKTIDTFLCLGINWFLSVIFYGLILYAIDLRMRQIIHSVINKIINKIRKILNR